ncbi:neurofascin isoform X4 [Syngnathus typhle]|uniref:neurofascin isoform X4 n=1 Tax=Syngnathus typhle TaxID=161592 RepID=UPI002A69AF4F|nr:neurofascin isoform X4 [Syngnathus typhle]
MATRVQAAAAAAAALLMLLAQSARPVDVPLEIRQPPTITKQSTKEHIVDPKDNMVIECEAEGNPHPIFSWRRNGKYFNVARDPQASMRRRSGTLDISARNDPRQYEAEYQCIASNQYGSAYSDKIRVRLYRAPVWPREIVEPVVISAGSPLVLACDPPAGPPKPDTYWMSSCSYARPFNWPIQTAFPSMRAVRQDHRVSAGLNGDLYFSNVLPNDSASDFCCSARFPYKNAIQQKMPVVVKVVSTRAVEEAAPTWLSPTGSSSSVLVLLGEERLLECIAAGVPTPHISWTKNSEDLAESPRLKLRHFNKMLQMPKAGFEDAGEYVCTATNKMGSIQHTFAVTVKAAPFWLEKPRHLVLAPEESGRLVCRADGAPHPTVRWFINGEPIEGAAAAAQANRQVSGDTLSLSSVTAADTAVYQCNASNPYGYVLANAFVNVLHATPRILGARNEVIKVVEGRGAFLDCRYFGSPLPDLRWSKYGQGTLEGNRFKTHSNGTLEIRRTQIEDQGTYACAVSNVAGRDETQVRIEVKEPTLILKRPQDTRVIRGSEVRLECAAKADATAPITTAWMKDTKSVTLGRRIWLDESNLVLGNVNRGDAGVYTCHIENELEQKSASARLMVLDYPNAPSKLELSDPYERSVRLTWVPGDSNFSPITEYLVQYDDDDWLPGKWKNLSTYPGSLNSVILHLTPFTYYQFRVIAVNQIGASRPSRPSVRFQTSGAPPDVIPKNVKGVGTWGNNMEISWEPLTYREWNGPHLKYLVWWRRRDSREEWKNATTKWLKYYIYDADTFTPYELKVQAANDFGLGPESPVVIGYSGEDRPVSAPQNPRLSDIQATRATVRWDPVPQSSIMGQLKEYKVYYWRDSSQLRWLRVSRATRSRAFAETGPEPSGLLTDLLPYSNYKMYMVVANGRYEGPPSNYVHFSTPEGVPSAPTSFRIRQRHLDSIYVDWEPPAEPNGIISGYSLKYQTVNASRGEEQRVEEFPPNVTSFSLRRDDRYTRYRFSVAARTRLGLGPWHTEESPHYTTEIYAQDQVDVSTKGWFVGVMCAVALVVLTLLVVCFVKRSRGGKYPVREKKATALEAVDDVDQDGSFDYRSSLERLARVTALPYPRWEEERGLQRGPPSMEAVMKRCESDDSLVDYGDGGGEVPFTEDGSFIGQYTAPRRDVRDLDFGGSLELHSPLNAIYSLA